MSQQPPDISIDEQIACAARELRMRESVFPKWVASERMDAQKAEHEIACMKAILGTLNKVKDQQEGSLF